MSRRLLMVMIFVLGSLLLFGLCFGQMKLPGDWRFRTSFNRDFRFQDSTIVIIAQPKIAHIYLNGEVVKIYKDGVVWNVFK
jgi:hypothetical protein